MEVEYLGLVRSAIPFLILEDVLVEVDIGHKIPDTLTLTIGW